ncbi:MAG: PAS domain S-box protein [bacterium]
MAIYEGLPIGVYRVTPGGKIVQANSAFAEILGYPNPQSLIGKNTHSLLVDPQDRQRESQLLQETGVVSGFPIRLRRLNGKVIWCEDHVRAIRLKTGVAYQEGSIIDISERKRVEEALRESEEKFRSIFENAGVGVALIDTSGRVLMVNEVHCRFLGYSRKELVGSRYEKFLVYPFVRGFLSLGLMKSYGIEKRYLRKDGQSVWGRINVAAVNDPYGGPEYLVIMCEDVTKSKRIEEALKDHQRLVERIADSAPVLIYIYDLKERRSIYVNRTASGFIGYTRDRIQQLGADFFQQNLHPNDLHVLDQLRDRFVNAPKDTVIEAEFRMRSASGEWRPLLSWNTLFGRTSDEIPRQILGSAIDITEQKRGQEEIQRYQEALRSLTSELALAEQKQRSQIALALHDQIGAELALARMKLRSIQKKVDGQEIAVELEGVTEILEEALLHTRSLTFDLSPPILDQLGLEAALAWLAGQMQQRFGLVVNCQIPGKRLLLDAKARVILFQAVKELLVNVMKHAQVGEATIRLMQSASWVKVIVQDKGAGFAQETRKLMQVDGGFGLFSMHERLQYLGGKMEVESQPGRGTKVVLQVPIDKPRPRAHQGSGGKVRASAIARGSAQGNGISSRMESAK